MSNRDVKSIDSLRKKITQVHELISTSFHEAGHTVYGLLHYMEIESVSVFENKKNKRIFGNCDFHFFDLQEIKDHVLLNELVKSEICLKYAGLAAEKHNFKIISGSDKFPIFLRDGSSDDTAEAAQLIKNYNLVPPGKKRYVFKKKLIKETLGELQDHWDAVVLVAHELFRKKKLNFEELKILLIKKTDNREFWKEQFKVINHIYDNYETLDEKELKSIILR